jgi:methanesulfonate monooxygenase subunit beta
MIGPLPLPQHDSSLAAVHAAHSLIYDANLLLDDEAYFDWLTLCDRDFTYKISAHGPESRNVMAWLEHDKTGMLTLVERLPRHQSDHVHLTRHTSVYRIDLDDPVSIADIGASVVLRAISSVAIFRTSPDAAETQFYATGKYLDRIRIYGSTARFAARELRLETHKLAAGTRAPL